MYATNDLYQGQTSGQFSRIDRKGNRLTSVRADEFADYLRDGLAPKHPRIDVFHNFNLEFLDGEKLESLVAVKEMYEASWPDRFQGEWPGFYLEYRLDSFLRTRGLTRHQVPEVER